MKWNSSTGSILRSRVGEWWANAWRWIVMAAGTALVVFLILDRARPYGLTLAFAVAVLVIGLVLTGSRPLAIVLLSMPALLVSLRVGLGGGDLTVSDAALAAAFAVSVLFGYRPYSRSLKALLWLNALYQFATLFTVIVHPYVQNTVEWFHAWLLISGALVVGWAAGRAGYAGLAFGALLAAGCVLAVGTIITGVAQYAQGDFGAVYPAVPWALHKNFVGTTLAFLVLVAFINPSWAGLSKGFVRAAFWLMLVAVAMSQSRQAWIGLAVALSIVIFRRGGHRGLAVMIAIPAVWVAIVMVIDQVNSQNQFNSVFQRLNWFREVVHYWRTDPILGHGLRFWYVDPDLPYQPPQGVLEILASVGLVGFAAFVVMCIGMLVVLWRVDPRYGTLAVTVVLSRLVQGQFDLFWISVAVSVPFVIAGVCLGALARDESVPLSEHSEEVRSRDAVELRRFADSPTR
ncbi:O-antigen ligase family protein [Microbacterium sp. ARD31]|uniref:O-antigen ligase family protein n=1 Tax=Microbacterium sp. ARD31 TaxID=2962576 RepID=UPI002880F72B|nr:O-antigen ligase family protein [Microbacterium sp. ARD31]MDT0186466.1 O-antigen ligase family protein [Microbacterium sp. ARD31]